MEEDAGRGPHGGSDMKKGKDLTSHNHYVFHSASFWTDLSTALPVELNRVARFQIRLNTRQRSTRAFTSTSSSNLFTNDAPFLLPRLPRPPPCLPSRPRPRFRLRKSRPPYPIHPLP